jgi:hypothetical protein
MEYPKEFVQSANPVVIKMPGKARNASPAPSIRFLQEQAPPHFLNVNFAPTTEPPVPPMVPQATRVVFASLKNTTKTKNCPWPAPPARTVVCALNLEVCPSIYTRKQVIGNH